MIASVNPSVRPPVLPPITTRRRVSATCDWSMPARAHRRTLADRASMPVHRSHRLTTVASGFRIAESVAHARFREDDTRLGGVPLDLPPQVCDVYAEILLRVAERAAPDGVEDLLVRHGPAGMPGERLKDRPLDRRQADGRAAAARHPARDVHGEPIALDDGRSRAERRARPPELGADARHELA